MQYAPPTPKPPTIQPKELVQAHLWLRGMASVMTGVSRILMDREGLKVIDTEPTSLGWQQGAIYRTAPGWTNGVDVYLNTDILVPKIAQLGVVPEIVASVKGLVFHEDFHIVYTPKPVDVFRALGFKRPAMQAFNILEDQRIERLGIARWPHVRGYMIHLITEWLLKDGKPSDTAHVLLFGRDYLSKNLRRTARKLFLKGQWGQHVVQIEAIIKQYVKLVLPRDLTQACKLSQDLAAILYPKGNGTNDDDGGNGIGDHGDGGNVDDEAKNNPDKEKQEEDQTKAGDVDDTDLEEDQDPGDGGGQEEDSDDEPTGEGMGEPCDNGEPGEEGQGGSESETDGDGEGEGGGSGVSGDIPSDEPGQPGEGGKGESGDAEGEGEAGGSSSGGSSGGGDSTGDDELRKAAEEERQVVNDDPDFSEDVRDTMTNVRKAMAGTPRPNLEEQKSRRYVGAQGAPAVASQHTRRVIRELQDYVAPGWDRHMDTGRINKDDYLRRQPGNMDVFDQWNPGREKDASAEVVVLVDTSGSMYNDMVEASQAAWTIKSSMDALRIPCTVIAFSDEGRYIYKRTARTQPAKYRVMGSDGGTNPTSSLDEAIILLATSKAKSRLMFVISDGDFDHPPSATQRIAMLNGIGVTTCYVGIGTDGEWAGNKYRYYGCTSHGNVTNVMQIPSIVRDTVKAAITRMVGR